MRTTRAKKQTLPGGHTVCWHAEIQGRPRCSANQKKARPSQVERLMAAQVVMKLDGDGEVHGGRPPVQPRGVVFPLAQCLLGSLSQKHVAVEHLDIPYIARFIDQC